MKQVLLLILTVTLFSISYAQSNPNNRYCIDVIKSDGSKYYILYSDYTWEEGNEVTYDTYKWAKGESKTVKQSNSTEKPLGFSSSTSTSASAKSSSSKTSSYSTPSKKKTSRTYIRGPRGGCYYINTNGGKTYVDRSLCN